MAQTIKRPRQSSSPSSIRWYLPGLLYDLLLERLLRSIKKKVASLAITFNLFPLLDVCCGTGQQCRWLAAQAKPVMGLDINPRLMAFAFSKHPGIPFVCADASRLPFRPSSFKALVISFALHDKRPEIRVGMLAEAKKILSPEGRLILVDFEKPWNKKSRRGSLFSTLIERTAKGEHFRNNRDFLKRGGLRALVQEAGLKEINRYDIEAGACAIVLARFASPASHFL